ncbi:MAG: S26 family signal peptidase [Acidimicrobiales bacterium]
MVIARLLRSLPVSRAHFVVLEAQAGGAAHDSDEVEGRNIWRGARWRLARWLHIPTRVAISGPSMLPTLESGDHLLVRRTRRARPHELVVFFDPDGGPRLVVKRVVALHRQGLEVVGDNPGASRDSKDFGLVPYRRVVGVAWYRYAPASRSGRIR